MTQKEIIKKIKQHKDEPFDFIADDLINFLTFENAKPYLQDKYVKKVEKGTEKWEQKPATKKQAIKEIKNYMEFAWGKANDCRGLSASRSIEHMKAYLFIAKDDELYCKMEDYEYYGKPQLRAICEKYGIDWKKYDDDRWANDEMGNGKKAEEIAKI